MIDPQAYAIGMSLFLAFPGFVDSATSAPSNDPFLITTSLVPNNSFSSVFRGGSSSDASVILLSLVPVLLTKGSDQSIGSSIQLISAVPGTSSDQTSYSSTGGVSVDVQLDSTSLLYIVTLSPQSTFALVAQVGSLLGVVIVIGKISMNLFEMLFPKVSKSKQDSESRSSVAVHSPSSDSAVELA